MDQRLHFVTLVVTDLAACRRFYADGLGWVPALEAPEEVLMFHVGDKLVLSLWDEAHAVEEIGPVVRGGTPPVTLSHNCSDPAQVDAVLADAERAGAIVVPGQHRPWGGYSGYFTDPDGFRWEVAHNPHPIGGVLLP